MERLLRLFIFFLRLPVELHAVRRKPQLNSLLSLHLVVILCLTLMAGWLRFTAINFGLPDQDEAHLFRPDESILISRAISFGPNWNPHIAFYPPLQMYVQSAALRTYAALHGHWSDFRSMYADHNWALAYLIGRETTAAFGTATIVAIYAATVTFFGFGAALGAAAMAAVVTFHVLSSKAATTDVAAGFWTTLAIAMIFQIVRYGRWRHYLAAGIFSGLAIATKYPAGGILFGIAAAHLEVHFRRKGSLLDALRDGRIYVAMSAAILATICAAPYLVLDWSRTVSDFKLQWAQSMPGTMNPYGCSWLMLRALPNCFGIILECLVIGGLLWGAFNPKRGTLPLVVFIVVEFLALATVHRVFFRYFVIPLPAMVILAAVFASDITALAAAKLGRKLAAAGATAIVAAIIVSFLARDLELNRLLLRSDTRTLARQWVEAHIPAGSTIAVTQNGFPYGRPQLSSEYKLVPIDESLDALRARGILWVVSDSLDQLPRWSHGPSPRQQSELGAQAALVLDIDPIRPGAATPVFDPEDAFYVPIRNVASMERPGPRIRIWRLKKAGQF